MDRISKLLNGLALHELGLEIGPLHNPILRRPQANVLYVDHADTAALMQKYEADPDVSGEQIVPVDAVWSIGRLADALPYAPRVAHIVASHVCEHVPDLLWWLGELASVMRPDGSVRLIVPDRRYTFDHRRRESSLTDVLAAWVEQRRRPSPWQIVDFWTHYAPVSCEAAWRGEYPPGAGPNLNEMAAALQRAKEAAARSAYHDVHCWVFTPPSFLELMRGLAELDLLPFACARLYPTQPGELDFFVHLTLSDDRRRIRESWGAADAML